MSAHVSDAAMRYVVEGHRRGHFSKATLQSYRSILTRFADAIGDPEVSKLKRRHVAKFLAGLDCSPSTTRHRLSVVQTFCKWLVLTDQLAKDPACSFKPPKQPRYMPKPMTPEEVAKALAHAPDARGRLIITLMVQLGLRCGEVAAMQVGDIDPSRGLVLVHGKGNKERVLPITAEVRQALAAYLDECPANAGPLIRSRTGRALTPGYISDRVRKWLTDAGVKQRGHDGKSAHAFRHTAATDVLESGANIRQVQAMLGHGSLQTTQRYLGWSVEDLRDAMEGRHYRGGPVPGSTLEGGAR